MNQLDLPKMIENSIESFSVQHPWTALIVSFGAGLGIGASRNPHLLFRLNLPILNTLSASSSFFRDLNRPDLKRSE